MIKESTPEALDKLRAAGLRSIMATGDGETTAQAVAKALGITEVHGEVRPQDKVDLVAKLKAEGRRVAMAGDGINDAPALAASSVGIAMGGGTDVALETADAALLSNRVSGVAELVGLARTTLSNIWQNIFIALGLKAVFLVTTLLGISSLWMAILADTGATVLVTANALRLLRFRPATAASPGESA
jgi:Cd2+/Zn2+-exporting ATPase